MNRKMALPSHAPPTALSGPAIGGPSRLAFCVLLVGLAFLEVFVSFRGLSSTAGMEQAQLAREVARGHGWVTQCIRPAAWRQALDTTGKTPDLEAFPDSGSSPLPVLILAPLFKIAAPWWEYVPARDGAVYALDRVVAGVGAVALLLLIFQSHRLAWQLFDERVAAITAACLGFSAPMWELAVSGSPRILLALELVLALRLVTSLLEKVENGEPLSARVLGLGLVLALLMTTHWMGSLWVMVLLAGVGMILWNRGVLRQVMPGLLFPLGVLMAVWVSRNLEMTGDIMGAAKLTLRGLVSGAGEETVARRFTDVTEAAALPKVLRVLGLRLTAQGAEIYGHLGMILAAPLFILAWLHRFRRQVCSSVLWLLTGLLGASMVAMALFESVDELTDEHNVFIVLAPALTIFGAAMVTVAWSRVHGGGRTFAAQWGHGVVLVLVTAMPLLSALPDTLRAGLALRGKLSQWPPYAGDRVALVRLLLEPREIVFSDAPWFTAWYADVPSVWVPVRRTDFPLMKVEAEKAGHHVAGVVVTPVSATAPSVAQVMDGTWREWPDLIFRGPVLAFDREMRTWPDLPYPVAIPLVAFSAGDSEGLGLAMAFYTDRQRTLKTPAVITKAPSETSAKKP